MIWSQKYRANGKFKRSFFVVILALELVILSRSFTAMTGIRNLRMCLHSFRLGSIFEMSLAITETIFKKNFHRDFREKFDIFSKLNSDFIKQNNVSGVYRTLTPPPYSCMPIPISIWLSARLSKNYSSWKLKP